MPDFVKCFVEECVYNAKAHCTAPAIEVTTNSNTNDIVGTHAGTMCHTFSYQNEEFKNHRDSSAHAEQ